MIYSIIDTVKEVIERADEAKAEYEKTHSEMQFGRLLAFSEMLSVMKSDMLGVEEVESILDFDIDERYLLTPHK